MVLGDVEEGIKGGWPDGRPVNFNIGDTEVLVRREIKSLIGVRINGFDRNVERKPTSMASLSSSTAN